MTLFESVAAISRYKNPDGTPNEFAVSCVITKARRTIGWLSNADLVAWITEYAKQRDAEDAAKPKRERKPKVAPPPVTPPPLVLVLPNGGGTLTEQAAKDWTDLFGDAK